MLYMSETTTSTKTVRDVVKQIGLDLEDLKAKSTELRKDLDVNIALSVTCNNKVNTLVQKKEDTEKIKSHQIEQSATFNANFKSIQNKLDTCDRDYSLLSQKLDKLSTSLHNDGVDLKAKIETKFENERQYLDEQLTNLCTKLTSVINTLDTKLTEQISKVESETRF